MIDKYGREVSVNINAAGDEYTVDGVSFTFPHGTIEAKVLLAIDAMAPTGWVEPPVVPVKVPMWAVRTVLQNQGLFNQAQALVDASSDNALKNVWEYGNDADRQSPSIISLGTALGLTSEQIDQMFIAANNIVI